MKNVSMKVPDPLATRLEQESERRRVSKSEILREALEEFLERGSVPPADSFTARAAKYLGCVDGAPPDLSYNPEHLEGFGED